MIYALAPDRWGHGYATEVAGVIVGFWFDRCGLAGIEATVDLANGASARLLTKIGMACEGRRQNDDCSFTDFYAIERVGSSSR